MDIYTLGLALGGIGLTGMALGGIGRHSGGHQGGSHSGHGGPGGHVGHGGHSSHGGHAGHGGHAAHVMTGAVRGAGRAAQSGRSAGWFTAIMSPRVLFSFSLGFGATGALLHPLLFEPLLAAAAVTGGVAFERLLVTPIWNFLLRFGSNPATTLESVITEEATVVSTFDANGEGLISVEVDGQVVQLLGRLQATDRAMGLKVRPGTRIRIEEVNTERNRCTVSVI